MKPLRRGHFCCRAVVLLPLCILAEQPSVAQDTSTKIDPAAGLALREGNNQLAAHDYRGAFKAFQQANRIEKDACFACWVGVVRAQEGMKDWEGALRSADKSFSAAADDAERAMARVLRGDVQLSRGSDAKNWKAAEKDYRAAIALDPSKPGSHMRLAIALFRQGRDDEGKQEAQTYLEAEPNGSYSRDARMLIANPGHARHSYAPEFHMTTLQGEDVSLQELSGKVVVLDFWATWCGPCRESVGELRDLVKKYPKEDFVLISISADRDEQKWRQFVQQKKMDWRQYRDAAGAIQQAFGVRAFPTYLVIDRDGAILDRLEGLNPQDSVVHRLKEALPALFAVKPTK